MPRGLGTMRFQSQIGQFLKISLGCLYLNARILTKTGNKLIYFIKSKQDFVLGHDLKFHKVLCVTKRICDESLFELETEKGSLFLTKEHPIYIQNGKIEWKALKDIDIKKDNCFVLRKDKLIPIKIKNIKIVKYDNYLYNLEVEDVHSFIANNIVIHNSAFTWNQP
jgi:intein/homing endonuclease